MRPLASLIALLLVVSGCAGDLPPLPPETRPEIAAEEAGSWLAADRLEQEMAAAPHALTNPALTRYVQGVACRVAGRYCGDIRVHLLRQPGFNAAMAPNGALLIQSGLLLRLADEAQLAAVIGHELGHYVQRHSFAQAEHARRQGDIGAWIGLFGAALGAPGVSDFLRGETVLDTLAYGRDQERAADSFGLERLAAAGYDPSAAAEVWDLVQAEAEAGGKGLADRLLATHPAPAERRQRLRQAAASIGRDDTPRERGLAAYRAVLAPHRAAFLTDEVRLRQPTSTLALFRHLAERDGLDAVLAFHWGEVYRLRGWQDDRRKALATYAKALGFADVPAETHRSIGLVRRALGQRRGARFAFDRYLEHAPAATDRVVVEAYIDGRL